MKFALIVDNHSQCATTWGSCTAIVTWTLLLTSSPSRFALLRSKIYIESNVSEPEFILNPSECVEADRDEPEGDEGGVDATVRHHTRLLQVGFFVVTIIEAFIKKMLESRPEDALVKLLKTVETVETAETNGDTI